jgi:hypothetical protein
MVGHQLEWPWTLYVCQRKAANVLSLVVPQHGSRGQPMSSCTFVDPLGVQTIRRPGLFSGSSGEDVLGEFHRKISNFNCFLIC